ncbi:MAG: 50S ribosomal protein L1 [Bdellovibrionales bacterium CG10_big_fil_rev_8_21_14_0_10_45_34]|nr:MAG: 50S ribosomal protein L1 [Bdellovibrionales bacterium CG10_big_fil_rev_8_21_14_0_10_45_34]
MPTGKRYKAAVSTIDRQKKYDPADGLKLAIESALAKFDESIDVAFNLGVDPKQSDQQVRGAVSLPNGLGKTVRVLVFAKGPKENEAKEAGADFVGADDLIEKIQGGWLDFDKVISTPDMMATVSMKVAKILGPRGLMPNPKLGTVTFDVGQAVSAEKKGKLSFRVDKFGNLHATIGRKTMGYDKLHANFMTLLNAVVKAKPSTSKGIYLRGLTVASTMGPGVRLDPSKASALVG